MKRSNGVIAGRLGQRLALVTLLGAMPGISGCEQGAEGDTVVEGEVAQAETTVSLAETGDVERGRLLVVQHACGDCHGGIANPNAPGWLAGVMTDLQLFQVGPFVTRPRNLTPDNETGLGRFTERQIFNALRYGLRPGETPDVEITSSMPGQGNFPANPKYLAVPMPWPSFRHMPDEDLLAIAAYLKRGLKPVSNRVEDSDGPPDFWASEYTPEKIGTYPLPPFPATNEVASR
jgi:mono/diheme cytochrome c family protein